MHRDARLLAKDRTAADLKSLNTTSHCSPPVASKQFALIATILLAALMTGCAHAPHEETHSASPLKGDAAVRTEIARLAPLVAAGTVTDEDLKDEHSY